VQQVLPNAVDLEIFRPVQKAIDGPLRVGIIANLSPIKGHEDFLAMARELSTSGPACEFWIVGEEIVPSGYRQHIQALAAEMDLTHRIRFIGFESNVAAMINELDVVVSCSRYESFGRSLIEAMACERPVVATAVGGVPEVIEDGMTGFLAPPHMPLRLAAAVRRLLEDRNLRSVIGRQGRLRVEKLFSLDTHVAEIIGHYQQLLGDVGERAERRSA
jgi:glycosyltransferase involved in cell wall biosynthesis